MDLFASVGKAVAHDEIVPFKIKNKKIVLESGTTDFDGTLTLRFVQVRIAFFLLYLSNLNLLNFKGNFDNPKINAFYIMKGLPAGKTLFTLYSYTYCIFIHDYIMF